MANFEDFMNKCLKILQSGKQISKIKAEKKTKIIEKYH